MAEDRHRDWVDTASKLLLPIVIFVTGLMFSYEKDKNDRANQQFERESGVLKLAASSNGTERTLGLKIIEIQLKQGKFSQEMLPVVQAISQGRPSDASTQTAQGILTTAAQNPEIGKQIEPVQKNHVPTVYLQIAREDQRAKAGELQATLQTAGFTVPAIELVTPGTTNTYIRYFSTDAKPRADETLKIMRNMGFDVKEQDFTALNQGKVPSGQIEVWIGEKQNLISGQ